MVQRGGVIGAACRKPKDEGSSPPEDPLNSEDGECWTPPATLLIYQTYARNLLPQRAYLLLE